MKLTRKVLAMILSFATMFCLTQPSFAASMDEQVENINSSVSSDEVYVVNRDTEEFQRAIDILDLTPEEVANSTIYSVPVETTATTSQVVLNAGDFCAFPEFTFTGYNTGRYWTCKGNRIKWGVGYKTTDTSSNASDVVLSVQLFQYGRDTDIDHVNIFYGHGTYSSPILSAKKNVDYNFVYSCKYFTGGGNARAKVSVYVSVLS